MNEELISQIVQHILSDSSFQALLNGYRSGNEAGRMAVKKPALVLLNYAADLDTILNAVKKRWGTEYALTVLGSESIAQANPALPEGLSWTTPQEALTLTGWAQIIVPACSANTLAKAALGIRDNPLTELIGRGIMQGTPIALAVEFLGLTAQTPQSYRELYEGYLQTVQTYGVQVYAKIGDQETLTISSGKAATAAAAGTNIVSTGTDTQAILKAIIAAAKPNLGSAQSASQGQGGVPAKGIPGPECPEEIRFGKKFLGDKEAYAFPEISRVWISRNTVISPLARDTLRLRRVELCFDEEGRR